MHQSQVLVTCLARTKTITVSPANLKKKKKKKSHPPNQASSQVGTTGILHNSS